MSDTQGDTKYAGRRMPSEAARVLSIKYGLILPQNVQWLDQLYTLISDEAFISSSDDRNGIFAWSVPRATLHASPKSDFFLKGGYCDKALLRRKLSLKDLGSVEISMAIALDFLYWSSVPSFEHFVCLYEFPYVFFLLENARAEQNDMDADKAIELLNASAFNSLYSDGFKSIVASGVQQLFPAYKLIEGRLKKTN